MNRNFYDVYYDNIKKRDDKEKEEEYINFVHMIKIIFQIMIWELMIQYWGRRNMTSQTNIFKLFFLYN